MILMPFAELHATAMPSSKKLPAEIREVSNFGDQIWLQISGREKIRLDFRTNFSTLLCKSA